MISECRLFITLARLFLCNSRLSVSCVAFRTMSSNGFSTAGTVMDCFTTRLTFSTLLHLFVCKKFILFRCDLERCLDRQIVSNMPQKYAIAHGPKAKVTLCEYDQPLAVAKQNSGRSTTRSKCARASGGAIPKEKLR